MTECRVCQGTGIAEKQEAWCDIPVPRAKLEALMAAAKALDVFLQYVNGQFDNKLYQEVYREALAASNAVRAAGIMEERTETAPSEKEE